MFKSEVHFNYCTDQIMVLKIVPMVVKATKYYEDPESKGCGHRIDRLLENGAKCLWMINKNLQT